MCKSVVAQGETKTKLNVYCTMHTQIGKGMITS